MEREVLILRLVRERETVYKFTYSKVIEVIQVIAINV